MAKSIPNEFIGRVLTDADFRAALFADPQGTVDSEGLEVSQTIIDAIANMNAEEFETALQDFTASVKSGRGPE